MTADPVIEATGLTAGYGETVILDEITARFERGLITCVIGGSGCGKSTLLRCAMGLLRPMGGSIRMLGADLGELHEEERAELLSRVGFMFQYGALLGSLSIGENLSIPVRAHTRLPVDVVDAMVRMKLELVQLDGSFDKLPSELSGGMRKRAGLARAIMLDPELLLCDEPSAGLDPVTAVRLDDLLLRLKSLLGISMVIVTHELASIRRIADRIIMLHDRGVRYAGTLDDALACDDPVVRAFFDRDTDDERIARTTLHDALLSGARP